MQKKNVRITSVLNFPSIRSFQNCPCIDYKYSLLNFTKIIYIKASSESSISQLKESYVKDFICFKCYQAFILSCFHDIEGFHNLHVQQNSSHFFVVHLPAKALTVPKNDI